MPNSLGTRAPETGEPTFVPSCIQGVLAHKYAPYGQVCDGQPGYRLKRCRDGLSYGNYAAGKRESSCMFCMSELNSSGKCFQVLENQCLLLNSLNGQLCGFGFLFFQTVLLLGLGAIAGQGPFPAGSLHVATLFWKLRKFGSMNMSCSMPPDLRARQWS